jgi:hypothetical protein
MQYGKFSRIIIYQELKQEVLIVNCILVWTGFAEYSKYAPTSKGDLDSYEDEEDSFCNLGYLFNQLGMCMIEVGLAIARLCDAHSLNGNLW